VARSGALELTAIPWADVARFPVSPETIRTLRYMQDIESHAIIHLRSRLATRAVDDPEVATFLTCWLSGSLDGPFVEVSHRSKGESTRR